PHLDGQLRNAGIQLMQTVDREEERRERESGPEQPVAEEAAGAARVADHLQRKLHQRIAQPLLLCPLAPQDRRQAEERGVDRADEDAPAQDRQDPELPWNRLAIEVALVEGARDLLFRLAARVPRDHPRPDVRKEELLPVVAGAGEV